MTDLRHKLDKETSWIRKQEAPLPRDGRGKRIETKAKHARVS
jgi:hypothetical protein